MLKFFVFAALFSLINALCPEGSYEWQTNCYFFQVNSTGFADAESLCAQIGGHLASIHDGFTNALLAQKGQTYFHQSTVADFWIGLTNLVIPGNWTWMDGTSLDFTDWAPGNLQNSTANCAVLTTADGRWRTDDCFKTKPYVCKVDGSLFLPSTTTTTTTTTEKLTTTMSKYPLNYNCSLGFNYFEPTHSCYGVGSYFSNINWTQSEQYCENFVAHLSSIHSKEELNFLASYSTVADTDLWTGGFSNDGGRTWQWSDRTPWDYNPWVSGYPTNDTNYNCAEMSVYGLFNYPCTDTAARPICKYAVNY